MAPPEMTRQHRATNHTDLRLDVLQAAIAAIAAVLAPDQASLARAALAAPLAEVLAGLDWAEHSVDAAASSHSLIRGT
jgi:hypothetical protein